MNYTEFYTSNSSLEPEQYTGTTGITDMAETTESAIISSSNTDPPAVDYDIGWSSDRQSLEDQLSIRIIYGIIAILGIIGNSLVIFTVARVPGLHTLTNVFIVSLAVCDTITSVFLIPLHLGKFLKVCRIKSKAAISSICIVKQQRHCSLFRIVVLF